MENKYSNPIYLNDTKTEYLKILYNGIYLVVYYEYNEIKGDTIIATKNEDDKSYQFYNKNRKEKEAENKEELVEGTILFLEDFYEITLTENDKININNFIEF